jgi:putative intracellular protease/amidase
MNTVYVYVLDTLADWELGYVTAELNSRRFFKENAPHIAVKTVSDSKKPIKTMGGLTVVPDCLIGDMVVDQASVLILPGANTWSDTRHGAIVEKAVQFLAAGAMVCAICGATAPLAGCGVLDNRKHTSNGPGFLEMFVPAYRGQSFYVDAPSVADDNLITAGSTGGLLWARQIIEHLEVFTSDTLAAWYNYFSTGDPAAFYALMQTLPSAASAPQ